MEQAKIDKHKEIIDFLKSTFEFTYGFANFVALKVRKADAGSFEEDAPLIHQYAGKETLKPIFDDLLSKIQEFGEKITVTPKKDSSHWSNLLQNPASTSS